MQNGGRLQGTKMLYPLKFNPILVERVWGGQTLARFGKALPPGKRIGESWEISDRDEAQSVVTNGPDKGKTLRQLIEANGAELLGTNCRNAKRFPLLVKLLDARERLSLQVHPPAAVAAKLKGEPKTEMWYILDADPDAHLIAGLRRGVAAADFMRALEESPEKLERCVYRFRVGAGDCFYVPSGRMHAIDAGIALVEIQQNSDTTYRVYDWGRVGLDGKPRQLHISESLACINFQDIEPKKIVARVEPKIGGGCWHLVESEYFHASKIVLQNAWPDRCDGSSFHILACVGGSVGILTASGFEERLNVGEFALLPAALGTYTLTPLGENTEVLKSLVPAS
jgi:mannose-6-phosphate isomerase